MKIRYTNEPNIVTFERIRPGKRYWAFPVNINTPNVRHLIPVTEASLRKLMRSSIGKKLYASTSIYKIHPDEVLFSHPIMRNRNVLRGNLREYIQPLYRVKTPNRRTSRRKSN